MIWRPTLPDSIDGKPLATKISHVFREFPYDRLDASTGFWMRPEVVMALLLGYLFVSKPLFRWIGRTLLPSNPKESIGFRYAIAVHNLGLAVFSAITAWNSWAVVLEHARDYGAMATYCDTNGSLWRNGLGVWSTIFYISKFYEFVDTWILVLKGKKASFLQVYHHTGIAFIMWGAVASQAAWLSFVVLLNSVIHTLMYTYFFIKTLSPTTEIKAAKYLTMAQIGQFFTGIIGSSGVLYLGEECASQSARFALLLLHLYGYGLIGLFFTFAQRKYKKT